MHGKDATKGFDQATAHAVLAKLRMNIAAGGVVVVPVDWADVASLAEHLSAQHTWTQDYRSFDPLHVATALHLGVRELPTFDRNQKNSP